MGRVRRRDDDSRGKVQNVRGDSSDVPHRSAAIVVRATAPSEAGSRLGGRQGVLLLPVHPTEYHRQDQLQRNHATSLRQRSAGDVSDIAISNSTAGVSAVRV
jgi:hypothetical protein